MYDTLQAKDVPVAGTDILDSSGGTKCAGMFKGRLYNIEVISSGRVNKIIACIFFIHQLIV